jgi:hypothetical protein
MKIKALGAKDRQNQQVLRPCATLLALLSTASQIFKDPRGSQKPSRFISSHLKHLLYERWDRRDMNFFGWKSGTYAKEL